MGSHGAGDGQFEAPLALAVAPDYRVYVSDGNKDNVQVFTDPTAGKPVIVSVTPTSGKRKSVVTITGAVFGQVRGAGYVKFGAKKVTKYTSWTSTSIVCKVPKAAVYGKVKVRIVTPGGTSAPKRFTVKQ